MRTNITKRLTGCRSSLQIAARGWFLTFALPIPRQCFQMAEGPREPFHKLAGRHFLPGRMPHRKRLAGLCLHSGLVYRRGSRHIAREVRARGNDVVFRRLAVCASGCHADPRSVNALVCNQVILGIHCALVGVNFHHCPLASLSECLLLSRCRPFPCRSRTARQSPMTTLASACCLSG